MSTAVTVKRSITPKSKETRSQSQQQESMEKVACTHSSLPPHVEGSVHAILICHIPKLRWLTKYQSLYRSVTVKMTWWGEDETSATFKPQISGTKADHRQQPSTTVKYYIRSDLKQFSKYLTDATELLLKVHDAETNRVIGTVKVSNLSSLSVNSSIKGFLSIFSNKGDKLGELFISLRVFLPGPHDSSENLTAMSYISELSSPPSRRNSIVVNECHRPSQLENGLRTYTIGRANDIDKSNSADSSDNLLAERHSATTDPSQARILHSKNPPPGVQAYKELPTGKVVEELIDRASRLRETMIKSSLPKTGSSKRNNLVGNSASLPGKKNNGHRGRKFLEIPIDDVDVLVDNEGICDMLGIRASFKSSGNFNNSILTDLDGLENEDSLLDELLYGGGSIHLSNEKKRDASTEKRARSHSRPRTARSRSSSRTRVGGPSNRPRSAGRSRSLTRSSDSDMASRLSLDVPRSDIEDSGNETQDDDGLSNERIRLLNRVRTARIRIDHLRLNMLNDRELLSHSSFGRTNKSKRALTYYIEYQFPVSVKNPYGHTNGATEVMKISSKRFEPNNDIVFSHLSTYPCSFDKNTFRNWWRSLLIFKIYGRMSGATNPEQIGFSVVPLRNIFKAKGLHFEQALNVIDRTQMNDNQKIPNKVSKASCIGQLHLMLELDSDQKDFKDELDRIQLNEQRKPEMQRVSKSKRQAHDHGRVPKSFIPDESSTDLTDQLVVQLYLSIPQARNIPSNATSNNLPRNSYFVCRAFWNEEHMTSTVFWGTSTPRFNFEQKLPLLLTRSTIERMHQNFVIIELWDKKIGGPSDQIIGIVKIPLEQFYVSFKDKQISRVLLRAQYPVLSVDTWLPIIDPFTNKSAGDIQVLLALGTPDQISAVQVAHTGGDPHVSVSAENPSDIEPSSAMIEHQFEIMIESITGLRAFESMVWGESDCFIQYLFPTQQEEQRGNAISVKPFQLRTIRTATTLCTSDPTFHDTNKFRYVLSPADALHKYFYAACQSTTPIEASISFEVWSRFYYPNIRDQLLATGKLSAGKLCSMTTMLDANADEKSIQSFCIPLEIVKEEHSHAQHQYASSSAYGGDLSLTITYKRNIIKRSETQVVPSRLSDNHSQVCISVGIIRACGLKHATIFQGQHDARLNYASQVGVNTYAKLTWSFLSDIESRSTRTISRSFVPEFNHTIDFPVALVWSDHRNQSISLAEMLEHGELTIDVYHRMNSNEKQAEDILLCYCKIPLKDLIIRHTGIKGWYPLSSAVRLEVSSDSIEHSVGGIELFVRFGQQDDRRRMIDSAKTLGWLGDKYADQEEFLDDKKDLGSLVKISVDRIQLPLELAGQADKDRISVFAQYRFYDKMPIITKRKRAMITKDKLTCDLQFLKEHLFLCSAPFFWYLREEKLEIQIWMSENDTYDYSQSLPSTTDKLLGSIYVDLNPLCQRNRKSQRISAIFPLFKQGAKNLHGACVQIHVSMDTSQDFNELRNPSNTDSSNDAELESYLESRYLSVINNDRALRTIASNIFSVQINIEQAAHLPNIYSDEKHIHLPPNPYVTYTAADCGHLYRTQVLTSTVKPQWNYQQSVKLSVEHLFNEKKVFILKVWHKLNADIESIPEKSGDKVLGFVAIDLSPLLSGLQQISGWYNISDATGNVQGQLKVSIVPQEDLLQWRRSKYNSKPYESTRESPRSTTTSIPPLVLTDLSARSNTCSQISFNTSVIEDDSSKPSFLMSNLRRQLSELDVITERLKARYYSTSEISSVPISNRSDQTVSSTVLILDLPPTASSTHQNTVNAYPTRDLSEEMPESSKERSLLSGGLQVADALSLHNDQVRLAQELMTKANYLLETSKDFFVKPSAPSSSSSSTAVERRITPASPLTLPNFNTTNEFETIDHSPLMNRSIQRIDFQRNSYSSRHDALVWSDEEDHNDRHYVLSATQPASYHRSLLSTMVSPPTYGDDTDLVHIHPLNNLSAFNFDCQQMNVERASPFPTHPADTHHTIVEAKGTLHRETISPISINSQSPSQQSLTSGRSIVNSAQP